MEIYVKDHGNGLVSLCDKELIGRKLKHGDVEIEITARFYKGKDMGLKEAERLLGDATNLNIFGKKSVDLALKLGLIDKENVIEIDGVPHAQMISV